MKKFSPICIFTLTIAITILLIQPAVQAVDFKISGQINRAILWGDNGNDDDTKFVDNDNSSTRFRFTGSNDFDEVWKVGIVWEVEMQSNASNDTDIDIGENDDVGDITFSERKIEFYVNHNKFGGVWLGQGDSASWRPQRASYLQTLSAIPLSNTAVRSLFCTTPDSILPYPVVDSMM